MEDCTIKFKALSENAIMPKKATSGAIAFDLYAPKNINVMHGRCVIPLEFAIELPLGYEMKIEPKSGMTLNGMKDIDGIRRNCDVIAGKIDSDYRGEVGVLMYNRGAKFIIERGTKIAQATMYYSSPQWHFVAVDMLSDTQRGAGGFGSTGTK